MLVFRVSAFLAEKMKLSCIDLSIREGGLCRGEKARCGLDILFKGLEKGSVSQRFSLSDCCSTIAVKN